VFAAFNLEDGAIRGNYGDGILAYPSGLYGQEVGFSASWVLIEEDAVMLC